MCVGVLLPRSECDSEHKNAFLLACVDKGRFLQPCPGPWDELSLFLLHPTSAACPLTSLFLVAITFTATAWQAPVSFFLPCFALCFPLAHPTPVHTSLHPSLSVSFCPHPGCLLSASLTASAQPCWKPALGKNQPGTAAMGASMGSGPPGSHLVSPGLSWAQGRDPQQRGRNELPGNGAGTLIPSWGQE